MQFERAYLFLKKKLKQELPSWLSYHNLQHTKDVVKAVQHLAKAEGVSLREYILLSTAAAFHDVGFIDGYENHEELSCKAAINYLPQFDYSDEEIKDICKLIMVTKMPQHPKTHLGQILCDADLFYLGTDKFTETAERLFAEFKKKGIVKNREDWNITQSRFLNSHRFFTKTALSNYAEKKEKNMQQFLHPLSKP